MPPKKVNKTVKKTVQLKTPRRRIKKEKCSPVNVTEENIKIQQLSSTSIKDGDKKKDRVVSLNKNDINIMLANEVVGRQFPKKTTLLKEPINKAVLDLLKQTKSKAVLKRKRQLKNNKVPNKETLTSVAAPSEKNDRRKIKLKKFKYSPITVQKCVSQKDTNESSPSKTVTKKIRKNKAASKQEPAESNVTIEKSPEVVKPKIPRRKLSLNRKTATGGPRTRKKSQTISKETEPEVASENEITTQKENNKIVDASNTSNEQDIGQRRNSFASLSEMSWTKDISSSSNTTFATVSSKDFFLIDNKIPIIKLTNIDRKLKGEENNNISNVGKKLSSIQTIAIQFENSLCGKSAIENCDKLNAKNSVDEVDEAYPFVSNLSSSTSESFSDLEKSGQSAPVNKTNDTLEKLASKLKSFDLEIINWIGHTNKTPNPNVEKIHEKLRKHNFLKEEMDVIVHSKNIIRILSGYNQSAEEGPGMCSNIDDLQTGCENTLNADLRKSQSDDHFNDDAHNSSKELDCREQSDPQIEPIEEKVLAANKAIDNEAFDDDEDDALSLYAESITGIESSTNNSRVDWNEKCPDFDEYVPEPLLKNTFQTPEKVTYRPTKIIIDKQVENSDDGVGNICEKQNADSTSVNREQDNDTGLDETNLIYEDRLGNFKETPRTRDSITKLIQKAPLLMGSIYKPKTGPTSVVFKGVCFFNLISNCKKNACKFPHIPLEVEDVKENLKKISDTTFIQEYMLLRVWPGLRWKYGMTFVEECIRRRLTRIVGEIALDFITKVTNKVTIRDVVENVLLYFNETDLSVCEDLLKYKLQSKNMFLCDFFLNTIAESQNFSRFKSVFINLTEFMYSIGRTFCEGVATQVLERIVILPYDEGLARALLKIIRNTKTSLFSNSMIGNLEQQLASSNIELYEEFCSLRDQVLKSQSVLGNCYTKDVDRQNTNLNNLDKEKRYSPDTTNLDHLNKTTAEPKFTRTIDLNKISFLNVNGRTNSSSSDSCEDQRFPPKNRFKNWRGRKSYGANNNRVNMRHIQGNQTMRPPLRPPFKRRSDQAFGGSPSKFQRRNGSNFFNDFS